MAGGENTIPWSESLEHVRREAMDFADIGIYCFTFDGTVLFMDRVTLRVFELEDLYPEPAAVTGRKISDLMIHVEPEGSLREAIREQGFLHKRQWHFRTLKGNDRWLLEDCYLLRDENSGSDVIQVIFQDITEQHRALEALKVMEYRARAILDNMVEAVHLMGRDYRILLCNRTLLEWNKALRLDTNIEGKDIFDVYPFLSFKIREEYEHVFKTGTMLLSEEENRFGDRIVYTETRKIPLLENGITTRILTVMRDVTERRETERALRESEEKYRTLVEMFPHSLSIFQDGRVVFANRATVEMFRYPNVETILGQDIMAVVADREKERLRAYAQARYTVPPTAPEHYETVLRRADGEEFPAEVHVKMIAYGGRPAQQVLVSDITERKHALQAIQESEERYRDILHSIREGYYEVDLKGNFTFFNKALCRIFGYAADELRGMNYRQYYPDDERRDRVKAIYNEVFTTGQDREFVDWTIIRKDGSMAEMEVSVSLMRDSEGKPIGFRGMVRDVTERKKMVRTLQEVEARYRDLFENANDVMFTTDLNGKFLSLNKAGERLGGYSREEALQISIFDIVEPEFRDRIKLMMQHKLTADEATRYEVVVVAKDGRRIPLEVRTRLVYQDGVPVAVQGIARDITDRKGAEE